MRRRVSLAVAMTTALIAGACARRPALQGEPPAQALAIRFDNDARDHVHVYLIGMKREWFLGKVEPGAVVRLRVPEEVLTNGDAFVQLGVVTGSRMTVMAARDPRVRLTVAQPSSAILSHQWKFVQGQLMPQRLTRGR
jgi:hypothetical protein